MEIGRPGRDGTGGKIVAAKQTITDVTIDNIDRLKTHIKENAFVQSFCPESAAGGCPEFLKARGGNQR